MQKHTDHNSINEQGHRNNSNHEHSNAHDYLLKSGLTTSGVIIAPYIGDALNLSSTTVPEIMHAFHGAGHGTGLAGSINSLLADFPVVGEAITAGSFTTAVSSGVIGIGGVLLGNYIEEKNNKNNENKIPWGKIIKYTALATSVIIALPSILTGISVGITYLSSFIGTEAMSSVIPALAGTLGSVGEMHIANAGAGIGSILSHIITCGGAALSVTGAIYADNRHKHTLDKTPHKNNTQDQPKIKTEIIKNTTINKGEYCQILLQIKDDTGKILTAADLKETHGEKLHLLIIDKSLNDYHHIHPKYDEEKKSFIADFVPNSQKEYNVWSNFKLEKNGKHIVSKNEITAAFDRDILPLIQHTNLVENEKTKIEITVTPPLCAGIDSSLLIKVKNKSGNPIHLEQIMGAEAHLVGFSKDGENMIHCHPLENNQIANNDKSNKKLEFHVNPQQEGFTKFFLQMKIDGKETTIPFGQYIRPSPQITQRKNSIIPASKANNHHSMM